jgi:hypothetical protein
MFACPVVVAKSSMFASPLIAKSSRATAEFWPSPRSAKALCIVSPNESKILSLDFINEENTDF